jgi:hypothetical protein
LVATLSHFLELKYELDLLGFEHNVDLIEVQVNALGTQVHAASDSLASHILPSVTHSLPGGVGG